MRAYDLINNLPFLTILYILAALVLFISEQIEVVRDLTDNTPVQFAWRKQKKVVTKIIAACQDWGFSPGVYRSNWRLRRHRNYFKLLCNDQNIYEIYLDRKIIDKPRWFLYNIIDKNRYNE